MDRVAVFVDAGYLLAAGGLLCCGTRSRAEIDVAYEPLITMLAEQAKRHTGIELLRTYWYDAARDQIPTADHLKIGALPSTKLRLGRLSGDGKQKGTDALIYRDLSVLSRQRAMCAALLVAGDEDLREAVVTAQELGVRVTVVGVAAGTTKVNQSAALCAEADDNVVLDRQELAPFFARRAREAPSVQRVDAQHLVSRETAATFGRDALQADAEAAGRDFAVDLLSTAPDAAVAAVAVYPRVPHGIDAALLRFVEERVGSLYGDEARRRAARSGFWTALREHP